MLSIFESITNEHRLRHRWVGKPRKVTRYLRKHSLSIIMFSDMDKTLTQLTSSGLTTTFRVKTEFTSSGAVAGLVESPCVTSECRSFLPEACSPEKPNPVLDESLSLSRFFLARCCLKSRAERPSVSGVNRQLHVQIGCKLIIRTN